MILNINFKRVIKGSVMAEAAILIPILLGVTFFIIEFGNVLYLTNTLNQISRTAARYASVTPSYTQQGIIDASGASSLVPDISKFTLTVTPAPGVQRSVGSTITVEVQYDYIPIINPFGFFNINQDWVPVVRSSSVARSEVSNA
ncbi:MAG: hypothetical protein A3I68_03465 [Candidatus Melainabacteria bacterium RIFCSPLOWO2_02_FULL_35_15]|nr:MAG: hypothetical protein A3F80_03785 [Candidatus Melainabacteria bacterium RIFCSPLOWO2_12_FULL_35_11]OGI14661.1 MAG: hypothetical protein A3I68_03465 [Candidatus Melainabacteria bacterium RIFCSPLOWO2_02_FULL_35_15]